MLTFSNFLSPFLASSRAMSCDVVTMMALVTGYLRRDLLNRSRSRTMINLPSISLKSRSNACSQFISDDPCG